MATPNHPTDQTTQPARPAGTAGEGLDAYPTYHDGGNARSGSGSKPTDVNLPRSRRSYGLPMLIGVLAFGLVILVGIVLGGFNLFRTADEAMTPGDGTSSTPAAGTAAQPADAGTGQPREAAGTLDEEVEPQTESGPGEVEATPGEIDVPGGDVAPVETTPAQ